DAATHDPGGMLQGLLGSNGRELIERQVAEWATGSGQPNCLHLRVGAHAQALVDGVVFAVDREDRHIQATRGLGENFTRGYYALLIGQPHGLSGKDRRVRCFQAGDPTMAETTKST